MPFVLNSLQLATLVEGPNDASLTYVNPDAQLTMGYACSLSGDLAVCSTVSGTETIFATMTASRFVIQVGNTAAAAQTESATPPATATPSKPSQTSQPSQTSGNATPSAPTPTSSTSNAKMLTPYLTVIFMSTIMLAALA